jgi:hypothetical protein
MLEVATSNERISRLEAALAAEKERAAQLEKERDLLRASHERLRLELKLLKLRLYVSKAERVDTTQLELEFQQKLRQVEELAGTLGMPSDDEEDEGAPQDGAGAKRKASGRRDLRSLPLEERRVEKEGRIGYRSR